MVMDHVYTVRPAGRHILTIGRDLIQDQYAAIVELVKNAYDADSPDVQVCFIRDPSVRELTIVVQDHGHGMSRDVVINSWLVPSTPDKLKRGTSPKGRTLQGRKGIGRYAAAILGDELLLETVAGGKKTTVLLDWRQFEKAAHLDDVEVLVETKKCDAPDGTCLTIRGDEAHLRQWNDEQLRKLQFELRKLVSPLAGPFRKSRKPDPFSIALTFKRIPGVEDADNLPITPFPVVQLFDYRISGGIESDGKGTLTYECQKARNTVSEKVEVDLGAPTGCGALRFDLRVYDREPEAIDQLIARGLRNSQGAALGRLEAKQLLNELNGIGVYRHGFRIRPLGDPDFDWLELNKRRIQEPTMRIGGNQVIGLVEIQAEEQSGLEEKSARDGLRDNASFRKLKEISAGVVGELEHRRAAYRMKAGLSRGNRKVEAQLQRLYDLDDLRKKVQRKLSELGATKAAVAAVDTLLVVEARDKSEVVQELREAVAVYQGQATLGKIMNVVVHEARRPLNFFKNQIPNLNFWAAELQKKYDPSVLAEVQEIAPGLATNSELLVHLFGRLDPLAAAKRGPQRDLLLRSVLRGAVKVFEEELIRHRVKWVVNCPDELTVHAWEQDLYAIFTNLIDNSVFWLAAKGKQQREITVNAVGDHDGKRLRYVDFRDSGPGIEPHLIESGVIFEPEFTTKPAGQGQGLGLAIAGEAASRNGLELKAIENAHGAYFRLEPLALKETTSD